MTFEKLVSTSRTRLRHLYSIKPEVGANLIHFLPNEAQEWLLKRFWYANFIHKARKLGFSTLIQLMAGDRAIWNKNQKVVVIDKTLPDAQAKLDMVRTAWANIGLAVPGLDAGEREALHGKVHSMCGPLATDSATALKWPNGSEVVATTSPRGATPNWLHVSELGSVALDDPRKASEIREGALEAVGGLGNFAIFESTHKGGKVGVNYELAKAAMDHEPLFQKYDELLAGGMKAKEAIDKLDLNPGMLRFHFFAWWQKAENAVPVPKGYQLPTEAKDYFIKLRDERGLTFSNRQMRWWAQKKNTLRENMSREHPTTPEEAWEAPIEGAIYAGIIADLRAKGRIGGQFEADPRLPVHVFTDLGRDDSTALWFVQERGEDTLWLDHYEHSGEDLSHYANIIRQKRSQFPSLATVFLPHDANRKVIEAKLSAFQQMREALADLQGVEIKVLPQCRSIWDGINELRRHLERSAFHARCCEPRVVDFVEEPSGVGCLEAYRKRPEEVGKSGTGAPIHDKHSHSADAARYFAEAKGLGLVSREIAVRKKRRQQMQAIM